jgi:hypothetical protein
MWIKKFIGILAINQKSPKDITEGILLQILSISLKFKSIIIVFLKGFKKKEPSAGQRFAFLNCRSLFLSEIKITRSL